jgi:hypothetical protein
MNLPNFPNVDLFSAGINALNGVLVARNPSHNRGYTLMGLLIMAFFGGIGGGVSRDLLLNEIPGPLYNPMYLIVCVLMGLLGLAIYQYAESKEERFRTRTLAFFKSFTLPWFAILGAHKALEHDLGIFAAIVVEASSRPPPAECSSFSSPASPSRDAGGAVVTTAVLAALIYHDRAVCERHRVPFATLIAALGAFLFRVFASRDHFPQIVRMRRRAKARARVQLTARAA